MSAEKTYYPVLLDLSSRTALVVGGGEVALRKAEGLLAAGARVRVVAPQVCGELRSAAGVECLERPYEADVLEGLALAIAATDSPQVNSQVAADCRARGVLCNVVDVPEQCDFIVPSVLRRGPLLIAVSTGGASPSAAGRIRRQIEERFDQAYGLWLETLGGLRQQLRDRVADEATRRKVFVRLSEADVLEAARRGTDALRKHVAGILDGFGLTPREEERR